MCTKITNLIKDKAMQIGFDLIGISPVGDYPESQYFKKWLAKGYHAGMDYMDRNGKEREDVRNVVPGARSVISCALNYNSDIPYSTEMSDPKRGWISRYAWSEDYHFRVKEMIDQLKSYVKDVSESELNSRAYVDTGPVLERSYAKYAGIGWTGKNTCIINQEIGSWLFLSEIITDIELEYDNPAPDRCGTCTKCIDACPTDAIRQPYVLDSNRCISYLTIENKGEIPEDKREGIGNNIFGCDICQDVCPWNREAGTGDDKSWPEQDLYAPELSRMISLKDGGFNKKFRKSPLKRAKRRGFLRNVLVAIGNSADRSHIGQVEECLEDKEPLVRSHAVWALWKLEGVSCFDKLSVMLSTENDEVVRNEIHRILDGN